MKTDVQARPLVAIACGGTGGHLFPGIAVADELLLRGCDVLLLISPKEVDQQAVKSATRMAVATLPAIGLTRGHWLAFAVGFWKSLRTARQLFRRRPPQAVLAMGGFTSAPPILAAKTCGATTFLHESNAIPGKANRWLARLVDQAFVGFSAAAPRLRGKKVEVTGVPVRSQFRFGSRAACRLALGLEPEDPVLLVVGGSQGAHRLNELVVQALPLILERVPRAQFVHLTGQSDFEEVRNAYQQRACKAVVRAFLNEMHLALGAADAAVSRAGGSSLAELAAMQLPAVLIPYPFAADDHQCHNARLLADQGAALLLEQSVTGPAALAEQVLKLLLDASARAAMSQALLRCHAPHAAGLIADKVLAAVRAIGWRPEGPGIAADSASFRDTQSALS